MDTYHQQLLLEYLGYSPGKLDGIAGKQTESAIRAFQQDNALTVDGIWGAQTEKMAKNNVSVGTLRKVAVAENATTNVPETNVGNITGTWWDSIKYFKRQEFACPCPRCGGFPYEPVEPLVRLADKVREHFGAPATVSSGVRCEAHNAEVGGVANSKHRYGKAMDFCIKGVSSANLDAYVGSLVGVSYHYRIDNNFVHMDVP